MVSYHISTRSNTDLLSSRLKAVELVNMFNLLSLCEAPSWNEGSGCHPVSDKAATSPFLWEQGQLSFGL